MISQFDLIETERLLLGRPESSDIGPWTEMLTDQEVARYLGPPIDSRDAVAAHIRTIRERHKADGFGLLAVVLREDGRVIGRSGFLVWDSRTLDRELAMTLRPPPEPGSARREA